MTGFDDLILDALPYLAVEEISAAQGTTWRWGYSVTDHAGNDVDLTSGFTGSCSIREKGGVSDVVAVTVTFPVTGQILCAIAPTLSDDVARGTYYHELKIIRASDSAQILAVGAGDSVFLVKKRVAL